MNSNQYFFGQKPIRRIYEGDKLVYEAPVLTEAKPDSRPLAQAMITSLVVGDRIELYRNSNIRSSPQIAVATLIGINLQGSRGSIIEGPTIGTNNIVWYRINFDRTMFNGWVASDNLRSIPVTSAIERTPSFFKNGQIVSVFRKANLRVLPSVTGTLIKVLPAEIKGTITNGPFKDPNNNVWYELSFIDGSQGWIASDNLRYLNN